MGSIQYPEVVTQCRCYSDNRRMCSTGQLTLPNINRKTIDYEGAGTAGTMTVPILGNLEAMEAVFAAPIVTEEMIATFSAGRHTLEFRAIIQGRGARNSVIEQRFSCFMTVMAHGVTQGNIQNANQMGSTAQMSVIAIRTAIDDVVLYNIDVENNIVQIRNQNGELIDDNETARQWLAN